MQCSKHQIGWLSREHGESEGELGCGIVNGIIGTEDGAFNDPCGVAFDPFNQIYIAD